jgi:5-methylcytosine-specific restriction endonuclease McrA
MPSTCFKCVYFDFPKHSSSAHVHCEMLFNEGGWDINHILRVALGGTNAIENLEALCKNCHGVVTANERIRDGF